MASKTEQVSVRMEPDTLTLAEEVTAMLGTVGGLDSPSRALVLRTALRRGLELMRDELKAKQPSGSKRSTK